MSLGGAKDEHFSCFHSSCQIGWKQPIYRREIFSPGSFPRVFLYQTFKNMTSYRSYWIYSIYKLRFALKHVASKAAGHPLLRSVEKPKKLWLRRICRTQPNTRQRGGTQWAEELYTREYRLIIMRSS